MTKLQKKIQAMTNKELISALLYTVQRNCFICAHKGYTPEQSAKREDALTEEAYKRFAPYEQ